MFGFCRDDAESRQHRIRLNLLSTRPFTLRPVIIISPFPFIGPLPFAPLLRIMWQSSPVTMVTGPFLGNVIADLVFFLSFPLYLNLPSHFLTLSPPFSLSHLHLSLFFSHGSCWIIDLMKYLAVILLSCWRLQLWPSRRRSWKPRAETTPLLI